MSNTVVKDLQRTKELKETQAELMKYKTENERLKIMLDDVQSQLAEARAAAEETRSALETIKLVEGRQSRKLELIRAYVDEKIPEPVISVVDALERFHEEVSALAFFISNVVTHKVPEIFPVELERSQEETRVLMGDKVHSIMVTNASTMHKRH